MKGVTAPPATAYWALADPPRRYVVYVRGIEEPVTLSLSDDARGAYQLRLFDPRTGRFTDRGTHRGSEAIKLTPPDRRDWVLVVRAKEAGE